MFLVFLGIILVPVFLPDPPGNATPLTHYTTFTNYLLWGLWFPLVFMSVIFTGRSWCGLLCPMGAAAEKANAYGPKFKIPSWLSWEGTPVVSFLIVTILGQTVGVRDHPEAAAEVFGGTMLAAIIIGWLFGSKKRARCRHACPIGLLLGVFSRLGAVEFAPWTRKSTTEGYTDRGICPTLIDISRKTESRHCIECFRCVNLMPVSNIEAIPSRRLFTLWGQQVLFDDTVSVRLGQLAVDDEFVVSKLSSVFVNSTFGFPFGISGNLPSGGAAFPMPTPGARVKLNLTDEVSWMTAAFAGDPAGKFDVRDPQWRNHDGTDPPPVNGSRLNVIIQLTMKGTFHAEEET
ncbi:carbohydrate porin, partial [Paramagnetospirillum marisnigri]|uniref:carbohydrate porin n=1 Tax=Paramagnetospirillum marisnigri TaxID=1285242 RepID=UPI001FE0B1F7